MSIDRILYKEIEFICENYDMRIFDEEIIQLSLMDFISTDKLFQDRIFVTSYTFKLKVRMLFKLFGFRDKLIGVRNHPLNGRLMNVITGRFYFGSFKNRLLKFIP